MTACGGQDRDDRRRGDSFGGGGFDMSFGPRLYYGSSLLGHQNTQPMLQGSGISGGLVVDCEGFNVGFLVLVQLQAVGCIRFAQGGTSEGSF